MTYQHILVPVDGSATSNRGLAEAIMIAKLTGARLRLVHVVDDLSFAIGVDGLGSGSEVISLLREAGESVLAAARSQVQAAGLRVDTVLHEAFSGRVCDLVVEDAATWPADLIVIGTHGRRGAGRLFMGSDAEQILRLAPVPVLLVRATASAQGA